MKKMKYKIWILSLLLTGLTSCSTNEIPVFDTNYSALNIWFGNNETALDSTSYNYSYALGEDSLMFNARVTGLPSAEDRFFTIEAYSGSLNEAEGSFRTKEYCIKAGETYATFPIYFDTSKLKDNSSFSGTDGHINFRLVENAEFVEGVDKMRKLNVVLKNYLAKPEEWDVAEYPYRPYAIYFGEYSQKKYSFMIQETGLVDFRISYTASVSYDEATNTISSTYATYLLSKLRQALDVYNQTHEKPLTDEESGSAVVF